jgi:hypothetical protein
MLGKSSMKSNASKSWRAECDDEAFDHLAWEFKAQQFFHSAKYMLGVFDPMPDQPATEHFMLPFTAEFVISLAVELIAKAHYLKLGSGPKERIYTHTLGDLGVDDHLSAEQIRLVRHAERYVVWAGRYPTPKWTKEVFKEEYDVPSMFENGIEKIDGEDIPNTASIPRIKMKIDLYLHIHACWEKANERK